MADVDVQQPEIKTEVETINKEEEITVEAPVDPPVESSQPAENAETDAVDSSEKVISEPTETQTAENAETAENTVNANSDDKKTTPAEQNTEESAQEKPQTVKRVVKRVVRASAPAGDGKAPPARRPAGATTATRTTTSTTRPAATTRTAPANGAARPGHASRTSVSRPATTRPAGAPTAGTTSRPTPTTGAATRRTTIGTTRPSVNVKENKPPVPRVVRRPAAPGAPPKDDAEVAKLKAHITELEQQLAGHKGDQKEVQDNHDVVVKQLDENKALVEGLNKEIELLKTQAGDQEKLASANAEELKVCLLCYIAVLLNHHSVSMKSSNLLNHPLRNPTRRRNMLSSLIKKFKWVNHKSLINLTQNSACRMNWHP